MGIDFTNRNEVITYIYGRIGRKAKDTGLEIVNAVDNCLRYFSRQDTQMPDKEKAQYILKAYNNELRKSYKKDRRYEYTHLDLDYAMTSAIDTESEAVFRTDIIGKFGEDIYQIYVDREAHDDTFINIGGRNGKSRFQASKDYFLVDNFVKTEYNYSNLYSEDEAHE